LNTKSTIGLPLIFLVVDAYTGQIESNTAANWGSKVALEGKC
jgi:signal recognition particle GTPase